MRPLIFVQRLRSSKFDLENNNNRLSNDDAMTTIKITKINGKKDTRAKRNNFNRYRNVLLYYVTDMHTELSTSKRKRKKQNLHINSADCALVNGVVYFMFILLVLFCVEYRSINGVGESLAVDFFFFVGIKSPAQTVQIHFLTIRMSQIRDALAVSHAHAHTWIFSFFLFISSSHTSMQCFGLAHRKRFTRKKTQNYFSLCNTFKAWDSTIRYVFFFCSSLLSLLQNNKVVLVFRRWKNHRSVAQRFVE